MDARQCREFDVVIFGASGYTGRYVLEELCDSVKSTNIKWAIAGRNIEKLKESLNIVQGYINNGVNIKDITIITADVEDTASVLSMCKRTRLILNCVGPYNMYGGDEIVSACIESGTHCVDISAELKYLDTVQAKYFKIAREKGVYVVQACGFGSLPTDYGISLMKKQFNGDLNSVVYYVEIGEGPEGRTTGYGTLLSGIHSAKDFMFGQKYENMLKEEVFTTELSKHDYPLALKWMPVLYSNKVRKWCLKYMGPDVRNIKRSQMFRFNYLNEKPIEFQGYVQLPSFFTLLWQSCLAIMFLFLSLFSPGRLLLEKFPSFLSAGLFSKDGPTRKQVLDGFTKFTFYGKGWKNKLSEDSDKHVTKPNAKIKLIITGPEPAYPLTAMCMVHAGLVILEEPDKIPLEGGVLTPGVAFVNTTLSGRLKERGMTFTFETEDELK